MKLFDLVSCFPTFFETDKENFLEPVRFERNEKFNIVRNCKKISVLELEKKKVSNSSEHAEKNDFAVFSKKYQNQYNYLSSNLVETNAHVLGLYQKIKDFELNSLQKMKNDIDSLSHKVEEGSCVSAPESEQLNTQTDLIYLYHKLDKISSTVKQLESRLQDMQEQDRSSPSHESFIRVLSQTDNQVPDYDLTYENQVPDYNLTYDRCVQTQNPQLQSRLLRFLLPSVVTLTAVVINMYLYVSSSRKFPY